MNKFDLMNGEPIEPPLPREPEVVAVEHHTLLHNVKVEGPLTLQGRIQVSNCVINGQLVVQGEGAIISNCEIRTNVGAGIHIEPEQQPTGELNA